MPPSDVFYFRNIRLAFRPPEMSRFVADAKGLLSLSTDSITALASDLEANAGFLDHDALTRTVSRHVAEESQARKVVRLIVYFDEIVNSHNLSISDILSSISKWRADPENGDAATLLPEQDIGPLAERLPLLLKQYDGLVRQTKAERLSDTLGQRLESIEMICDWRPVFDQNHTLVVGVIPLTTLKVVCTGGDGLPVTTEAVLSEKQVSELATMAQEATKKLAVLRSLAAEIHKPIPTVPVTEVAPLSGQGSS
jgi:hypothetical protein